MHGETTPCRAPRQAGATQSSGWLWQRALTFAMLCTAAAVLGFPAALAQSFPSRPIRFIVPFPPGGPTDVLGRVISQKLSEQVGQPVVADNRPGAGGNLGIELAAKARPDGYTIVLGAAPMAISPHLYAKLNYDPIRDFAPIALVGSMPNVLLVHSGVPAKTLAELVQLAKASPGKLNFGSGGVGASNHLANELLKGIARIDLVHVPFKGAPQAMLALMDGQIDMAVMGAPTAIPAVQSGKVRGLAVLGERRLPAIPGVPTAAEAGFPGYQVTTWYGVLAPAGTPKDIVSRLNAELAKVATEPASRDRIVGAGFDAITSTPEQFGEFMKAETTRWGEVIRTAGVRVE